MTTTSWPMGSNNHFSAVKRWQHRLSALMKGALNRLAELRRERRREEARQCEDLLALRDRLRSRLRTRLKR